MKSAGLTVVRMGESTWSLWEPADGRFEFQWMDRVVDAFAAAGIKVILGTPTYSMPTWLAKKHPELYVRPLGGTAVDYGMRQNMNYDDPVFRRYAARVVTQLARHYRDHPAVIGWQLDNETAPYGAANAGVFADFVTRLQAKFKTPEALNQAWFLSYWGQNVFDWADMPRPDFATNPSYKLEWSRFQRSRVTRYLGWQGELVRGLKRADQFVMHDFAGSMRSDVDEFAVARDLDVIGINIYHGAQDDMDGQWLAMQGDYARSLKQQNFFVTETNAQTIGWNSKGQYPPFDGQLRLAMYANVASGSNMQLYWHWHSIHAGQETYWKGVLGHDLEPGRAYAEVARTARELSRLGADIANLRVDSQVAILYSADSNSALGFMPFAKEDTNAEWSPGQTFGYNRLVRQLHQAFYNADVAVDFIPADAQDFAKYKLLVVPSLYVADAALLARIDAFVKRGGHVLMTFKSGFTNENSAVRWERAPGPLRAAAGVSYQEFSSLKKPVALKGDPFGAGAQNQVSTWAEFLELEGAQALAYYEDSFLGRWPAITRNRYGAGTLTYQGTMLSDDLQDAVVRDVLRQSGLGRASDPSAVRTRLAFDSKGRPLHFMLNFSSSSASTIHRGNAACDLLSRRPLAPGQRIEISAWDLLIAREQDRCE